MFILVYLKTYPLQVVQGRLFGMGQSKAHQWIHVLLLTRTLKALKFCSSKNAFDPPFRMAPFVLVHMQRDHRA